MIEIKDISNKELVTKVLEGTGEVNEIGEVKLPLIVSISSDMSVVDIFNVIINSEILTSKDMYELGSYLRTFADFHTPVEGPADKPKIPYRGF